MRRFAKQILRYLDELPDGSASPIEILNELGFGININELDDVLEIMKYKDLLILHRQMRSASASKYDFVKLTEAGRKSIR